MTTLNTFGAPERFHPRVDSDLTVRVEVNNRSFMVKTRDLSMAGIFLLGSPPVSLRRMVITIPLPGDREIVTGADVKRRDEDGVAVVFDQLDWDDLIALARYLHPRLD
ncbi:MAG TPA: PilZ domain-containing protein [Myxococcaceae bacterium]|nr:PilZ domain-containing protein [Myxococcaceae bacterium]